MKGKRTDNNQKALVEFARKCGIKVLVTSNLGQGFPDLIINFRGRLYFVEVKNNHTGYGKRGLNKNQLEMKEFLGDVLFVWTCESDIVNFLSHFDCA